MEQVVSIFLERIYSNLLPNSAELIANLSPNSVLNSHNPKVTELTQD